MSNSRDRARMRALAADLAAVENDEDASPEQLAAAVVRADQDRARLGLPPLQTDDDPPELEFYRRARALGLSRSRS